ncbi:hypothetical protein H072_8920 [Dactylellina haptotyla CBS 200.50]|uniref:Uncharacterized protein n=1 Tax=Dactylellina haptotyla (strain CBS 200.50) TaxID=1284197 RepID=S8BDU3_DACHA|nr:hypothetical protein H072_8920 [Dactylellina haptotyla CBS 200.50]
MQINSTALGFIVLGVVLGVCLAVGTLYLLLRKRQVEKSSRVMITMSGTTVVHGNGSRRFEDAVWIPSLVGPGHAAMDPLNNHRTGSSLYSPSSEGSFGFGKDMEGTAGEYERSPSPRIPAKRASYMSAKRLEIPDVLAEDDEERTYSEKGSAKGSTTSSANDSAVSMATIIPPTIIIEDVDAGVSTSADSGFEVEVDPIEIDIRTILKYQETQTGWIEDNRATSGG